MLSLYPYVYIIMFVRGLFWPKQPASALDAVKD